jgi:hypothetical protein
MAAEQLLTSVPHVGEDDLMLEPGLVSLASPRGLNETILGPVEEKEESAEGVHDVILTLDKHGEEEADE